MMLIRYRQADIPRGRFDYPIVRTSRSERRPATITWARMPPRLINPVYRLRPAVFAWPDGR